MTGRHSIEAALARFPGEYLLWTVYGWRRITYTYASTNCERIAEWATTAEHALTRLAQMRPNRYKAPLYATQSDETATAGVDHCADTDSATQRPLALPCWRGPSVSVCDRQPCGWDREKGYCARSWPAILCAR